MNVNNINTIKDDIKKNQSVLEDRTSNQGCLIVKPANKWIYDAKNRPIPRMLFDEFWFENEVCILFADTNVGKSILAVQIADSLSKGKGINGFKLESKPKKVLYLDLELSDKQFENRCSDNYANHYLFHENFLRGELNDVLELPKEYSCLEDYLCESLEKAIVDNNADVLIIDNLTYLSSENEKAKDASKLMKQLKSLTKSRNVSILILSHTPKRDSSNHITKNDLAGSKMLINFCDSCFTIGSSSQDPSFRYIKQIKQRNTEYKYHADNVVLCQLNKKINFLQFEIIGCAAEADHLKSSIATSIEDRDAKMFVLIEQGLSNVKIGKELGISESTVRQRRTKHNI